MARTTIVPAPAAMLAFGALLFGCGGDGGSSGDDDDDGDPPDAAPGEGATIATRLVSPPGVSPRRTTQDLLGQTLGTDTTSGVSSLRYFLGSVQICEALDVVGSGFMNQVNCIALYQGPSAPEYAIDPSEDYSNLAEIARADDDPTHFIDLIGSGERGLGEPTELTEADARDYNWGIVTWVPVVKLQADVPVGDGVVLHTHDGVSSYDDRRYPTVSATPLTDGPSELATVLHTNGGSYFRFQRPLTIDADDIAAGTAMTLDLVFNPEGIIKGYTGATAGPGQLEDAAGSRIAVPFLELTPVPHAPEATVTREAYAIHVRSGDDVFDLRLDLYYLTDDPEKTILGAEATPLYVAETTRPVVGFPKLIAIEADEVEGELVFRTHGGVGSAELGPAVLRGFVRTPDPDSDPTVDVMCASDGLTLDECGAGDSSVASYEHLGDVVL